MATSNTSTTINSLAKLQQSDILIIHLHLPDTYQHLGSLQTYLNDEELAHADDYLLPHLKQNYIARRAYLRLILASQIEASVKDICFSANSWDKPLLDPHIHKDTIEFNLSHSGDFALYALSLNHTVGVDIEQIKPKIVEDNLAETICSPMEFKKFQSLPQKTRCQAFFNLWTQKEAFIKAIGMGLSFPLQDFSVLVSAEKKCALQDVTSDTYDADDWNIVHIPTQAGYRAALCSRCDISAININYIELNLKKSNK